MEANNSLKLFEDRNIRVQWNLEQEEWYFSVVDIVAVLIGSDYQTGRKYWKTLKMRLNQEGSELVTNCYQLKMRANDGKLRDTDVMNTEQILRLIQSIPSKKAEPFKLWLAKVGKERIDEAYDPEITINRALDTYRKKGYSEEWINQRLKTIDIRKEFTDELKRVGITCQLFSDIIEHYDMCDKAEITESDQDLITNVVQYIYEHYSEHITLETLAKEFYVSPKALGMKLRKKLNVDLRMFVNDIRVQKAVQLRDDPKYKGLSLNDLASMCGFNDMRTFYRSYERVYGSHNI